jgi:uncharacterized protein
MNNRLALLFLSLLLPAVADAQSIAGKPFLSVQGHAEALVVPDVFPVEVTLKEISMTPAKSQALIEGLAQGVLASAGRLKVVDADIEVGNLSVSPEMKWDDDKEIEIFLGNSYERELKIRFRSLEDLKTFIADLPDSRNIRIDTQTFEVSNAAEIKRKLRRAAIDDAKKAAEEMADAVGKRLVDLQNVSDRAQTTAYSSSGYDSGQLDYVRVQGTALLAPGTVRSRGIVLREGVIKITADAFLIYVMGD